MKILLPQKLEELLKTNWTKFLEPTLLMKMVLETANNTNYPTVDSNPPVRRIVLNITKFAIENSNFEIWIEFTIPKEKGVLVGTHVFTLNLDGNFQLKETHGSILLPKS